MIYSVHIELNSSVITTKTPLIFPYPSGRLWPVVGGNFLLYFMVKIVFGKDNMVASTAKGSALAHCSGERCRSNISQQTGTQPDDISVCLQTYEKQYALSREGRS